MKAVILAGGYGTRLSEETISKPKPMVEIGGMPILWHIMKIYSSFHINDFIICLGYKGYMIKEYFSNYYLHMSDITFDMKTNEHIIHNNTSETWKITLIDTGIDTMTGGRLKKIKSYLDDDFCMTYGDGVADVNIEKLIEFHKTHGCLATLTAIQPLQRFGILDINDNDQVISFKEKQNDKRTYINSGFFVLSPKVLEYIHDDESFEKKPLEKLSRERQLKAFHHNGFWQCMDTLRDKNLLNDLWEQQKAPWKFWN